jgi:hypothetical protein
MRAHGAMTLILTFLNGLQFGFICGGALREWLGK